MNKEAPANKQNGDQSTITKKISNLLSAKEWAGIGSIISIIALLSTILIPHPIKIHGIVKDATNNAPIEGVKVSSQGLSNIIFPIYTDSEGVFTTILPNNIKNVKLSFAHVDYNTYELVKTPTRSKFYQIVEIRLNPVKEEIEENNTQSRIKESHDKVPIERIIKEDEIIIEDAKAVSFFAVRLKILHKYVKKYGVNKILIDGDTIHYRAREYYSNMPSNAPEYFIIENVKEGNHVFSIADHEVHINIVSNNQEVELTCN